MRIIDHGTRQYNEDGDDNNIMSLTQIAVKQYTLLSFVPEAVRNGHDSNRFETRSHVILSAS